jgi:cell division protein FtsB
MTSPKRSRIVLLWFALVFTFALNAFSQTASLQHNSNLRKSASTSSAVIEPLSAATQNLDGEIRPLPLASLTFSMIETFRFGTDFFLLFNT